MRKRLYVTGWAILFLLPVAFTVEILITQDLPRVYIWKWAILAAAVLLVYFARNRDDVFKHHIV